MAGEDAIIKTQPGEPKRNMLLKSAASASQTSRISRVAFMLRATTVLQKHEDNTGNSELCLWLMAVAAKLRWAIKHRYRSRRGRQMTPRY